MVRERSGSDEARAFLFYWNVRQNEAGENYPAPTGEYEFMDGRSFRFDWAWPESCVAVEVDGNAWNVRGGGKHMQDDDLWKYNYAVRLGWKVFRFSPKMLKNTPDECVDLVLDAVKK